MVLSEIKKNQVFYINEWPDMSSKFVALEDAHMEGTDPDIYWFVRSQNLITGKVTELSSHCKFLRLFDVQTDVALGMRINIKLKAV